MQRYTVYFIWKLLYVFRVVPPPNIRRAKKQPSFLLAQAIFEPNFFRMNIPSFL